MHELAVLAPSEAGIDRAPAKLAAQVRLAGLHSVKGFLQVPQPVGILQQFGPAVEDSILDPIGQGGEILQSVKAGRLQSALRVARRAAAVLGRAAMGASDADRMEPARTWLQPVLDADLMPPEIAHV